MAPNHWGGPQKRSGRLSVMAHNWFKRAPRPWPTRCNWSIWKRVTQPLAEIAALIVLYVELRPRCNESNLSPLVPAGDSVPQGPSQLRETSIMNRSTSSGWSLWNHTWVTSSIGEVGRWLTSAASRLVFVTRLEPSSSDQFRSWGQSKDIVISELSIDDFWPYVLTFLFSPRSKIAILSGMLHKLCSDRWRGGQKSFRFLSVSHNFTQHESFDLEHNKSSRWRPNSSSFHLFIFSFGRSRSRYCLSHLTVTY